ncbi:hypothetical protein EFR95_00475 [Lactobacillus amylovorus]|nr:hypothetical protein [Lactobacillus amylovorus]
MKKSINKQELICQLGESVLFWVKIAHNKRKLVMKGLFLRKVKHNKKFGFIFCLNFNLNIF